MRIFTVSKQHTTTRIHRRAGSSATPAEKAVVATEIAHEPSRWEVRREAFNGFNSPPGRF